MDTCTCDDETQTKTIECLNCKVSFNKPLDHFERINGCNIHHSSVAICSVGGSLCKPCEDQGYYLKYIGGDFIEEYEVKKKN